MYAELKKVPTMLILFLIAERGSKNCL